MSNEAEGPNLKTVFLYSCTDTGKAVFILSDLAFKALKTGNIIVSPDGQTLVSFSHDIEESSRQLNDMVVCTGMVDKQLLGFIMEEGAKPPKRKRKKRDAPDNSLQE
jgi:hypothetical protein